MHLHDARQRDDSHQVAHCVADRAAFADGNDRADDAGTFDRAGNGHAGRADARRFALCGRNGRKLNQQAQDRRQTLRIERI